MDVNEKNANVLQAPPYSQSSTVQGSSPPQYYSQPGQYAPQPGQVQYAPQPGQVQYAPQPVQYAPQPATVYTAAATNIVPAQVQVARGPTTKMPIYALVTSFVVTMVFFFWIPGFLCLIPAIILGVAAVNKKENNEIVNARKLSIISFTLVLVNIITFPIIAFAVVFGSVYGVSCGYTYGYSYYRYYYC